jgi:hypothetical protein
VFDLVFPNLNRQQANDQWKEQLKEKKDEKDNAEADD